MAAEDYRVENVQNTVYLDRGGRPVTGFVLGVYLIEFDELLEVRVPSMDEKVVAEACSKLLSDRQKIAGL